MPEEEKPKLESTGKIEKNIYVDSEVLDRFWIEDPISEYGKPTKAVLETLLFNRCDERVLLLMVSEDFTMEGEVISEGCDPISFDVESKLRSVVLKYMLNDEYFLARLSGGKKQEEENTFCQDASKETEVENTMDLPVDGASKIQEEKSLAYYLNEKPQDDECEKMVLPNEVQESVNVIQQYSGTIPYSGSISLRSTSSTASNQSFAFPILAQEWNSSPVRMAKPDKKQLTKKRRWKLKSWICCKF